MCSRCCLLSFLTGLVSRSEERAVVEHTPPPVFERESDAESLHDDGDMLAGL